MMINLYWWTGSGTSYDAKLPYDHKMVLSFPRVRSEKVSIMGNVIRQAANKDASLGVAVYSRLVPMAQAEIVRAMDFVTTWAYMTWKDSVYIVDFSAKVDDRIQAGKIQVDIDFKFISKVL